MTALDVLKDIRPGLGTGLVVMSVHLVAFEYSEKALSCGVVGAAPHRTHTTDHLMGLQKPSVFLRGKLTTPIGVQNDWGPGWPLPERHQHRLDDQLAVLTRTHRPAHHEPGIQIQYDAQGQPVFGGPKWSERPGVVELSPGLSSPNRTCTSQRIRLSIQALLKAKATSA